MDLALITQDFSPEVGGIETYATELAGRFATYCNTFIVMAPAKPTAESTDRRRTYPVHRVTSSNPFLGIRALPDAAPLLRRKGIRNVFHAQWQTLPASVTARWLGSVDHIFVAAHARELLFNPFAAIPGLCRWYEAYKRRMLSEVDLFFPVSDYTAGLLHDHGVPAQRIEVVINGTDPRMFYPADQQKARRVIGITADKVLLTITRLVSRKGVDTTLRAFREVLRHHPDSQYVVVGDGEQKRQLMQLADQLEIGHAIRFEGRVPHENLIHYYNACDVFVMPSKTERPDVEGFGIVFLEANACEKPVIGTFSGGIPSAVVNGETGILVEERDHRALASSISDLFTDTERAQMMGRKGRTRVLEEANWDRTAAKIIRHMENKI